MVGNGVTLFGEHAPGERMLAESLGNAYIWNRGIFALWRDELGVEVNSVAVDQAPIRRRLVAATL